MTSARTYSEANVGQTIGNKEQRQQPPFVAKLKPQRLARSGCCLTILLVEIWQSWSQQRLPVLLCLGVEEQTQFLLITSRLQARNKLQQELLHVLPCQSKVPTP